MNHSIKNHSAYGRCLYAENGIIEVYIPLDFGIRIGHFSLLGEQNVFFVQPNDMTTFSTKEGWRIRGGHRLWGAPESEKVYCPDNDPIDCEITGESITLTQKKDEWLGLVKSVTLTFDKNRIHLTHRIKNVSEQAFCGSLWGITVMAPGGVEYIKLHSREGGFDALHSVALWDYTNLGDERASYTKEEIILRSLDVDGKYKIGLRHPVSPIRYEVNGYTFLKSFEVKSGEAYPDSGVSYETFLSRYMTEMESLSPMVRLNYGEVAEHKETWELSLSAEDKK